MNYKHQSLIANCGPLHVQGKKAAITAEISSMEKEIGIGRGKDGIWRELRIVDRTPARIDVLKRTTAMPSLSAPSQELFCVSKAHILA